MVMKFMDQWEKFEKSGNIQDYLEYCAWSGSTDLTRFIISENMIIESGDLSGFKTDGNGASAQCTPGW